MHERNLKSFIEVLRKEQGQTMTEYALVLSLITIVTMAVFVGLGDGVERAVSTATAFLP